MDKVDLYIKMTEEIEIFINADNQLFANIYVEKRESSCKLFYCIGSPDTREDGHINYSGEKFESLSATLKTFVDTYAGKGNGISHFTIRISSSNQFKSENIKYSQSAIIRLLNTLTEYIEDLTFLESFRYLL